MAVAAEPLRRSRAVKPAPPAPGVRTARAAAAGQTRNDIVAVALKLFAKRGVDAVPLREIVLKSRQRNQSAIHYHFRDKRGLVAAVAQEMRERFQPYMDEALANLDAAERKGTIAAEDLVAALVMPVIRVYHSGESGQDVIRFVARLAADGGASGQSLLLREASAFLIALEPKFARHLPDKPREKLWLEILLAACSTVFGLTALGGLKHSPFGGQTPLYKGRREDSIRDFVDFICHGLLGRQTQN